MFKSLLIAFIVFTYIPKVLSYEYTIDVPKLTCTKDKVADGNTTISVKGKDAAILKFVWEVNFNITNNCTTQRCTLMAWRSVQNVYKALNYAKKPTEITLNNKILLSMVQYKINVTAKENDTNVESKLYILECTASGTPPKNNLHSFLRLLGPNVTYPDLTYTINAMLVNYDRPYYFQWEIQDHSEKLLRVEPTKGSTLSFKSNALITNQEYVIKCNVIDSEKGKLVATGTHDLVIHSRGIFLNIPLRNLQVGINHAFKLNAFYEDVDGLNGTVKIQWTCRGEKNENCPNFKSENSTFLESYKFPTFGKYQIEISAEKNGVKVSDSVEISVVRDGYVEIEVDDFATPVDPSKEIVIPVYVSGMVSGCTLQWSCLNLPGYGFVDLAKAPGNVNLLTTVTVRNDVFLNELDEYSNETVDKDYNLVISKPTGSWPGLGSNTTYAFRLNVTCPVPENDDTITEKVLKHVVLTADIHLPTTPVPVLSYLSVQPTEGVALTTTFQFDSKHNVDVVKGTPYLYRFGYFANNRAIFLSNVIDEMSWSSTLPYIDKGVHTVLECCNTYAACTQVNGTTVRTSLPAFSENEKIHFQLEIRQMMERQEYYKAFVRATDILLTYKGLNDKVLIADFEKFMTGLATDEVKKLVQLLDSGNSMWAIPCSHFIRDAELILDQISSDSLLHAVVTLRNKLSIHKDAEYLSKFVDVPTPDHFSHHHPNPLSIVRRKRETDKITLEEVKSYLVISELIITTGSDTKKVQQEKEHLVNQVDKFMVQLCSTLYQKPQSINLDLKTVTLALEKLNKNNLNRNFYIPREANTWNVNGRIKLGKCFVENVSFTNQLCIGKAIFKEYFNKTSYVYMVKVYGTKHSEQVKIQDMFCEAVLVVPVDKYDPLESEAKCALWKNKWDPFECKTLQTGPKTIQCQCGHLGYYALEYNAITTTASESITTSALTTTAFATPKVTLSSSIESQSVTTISIPTVPPTTIEFKTSKHPVVEVPEVITGNNEVPKPTSTPTDNKTEIDIKEKIAEVEYETVCYVVIGVSVIGTCTFLLGIKRILATTRKVYKDESDPPQYERLHDVELLDDCSISNKFLSR